MDPYFAKSKVEGMRSPFQKLGLATLAVVFVVVAGTSGLMWLEGMSPLNALYMTVITLSTVGFSEVTQLHDASRMFGVGLIVVDKSLLESGLKKEYGVTIIGIKHEGEKMILNPTPSTVLMERDIMILIGQTEQHGALSRELSL